MTPSPAARVAYDEWHRRFPVDAEADAPWHRLVRAHLEPSRDLAGRRILEIGSGRGGFAAWLAGRTPAPAAVVAVDFARTAIRMGRDFAQQRGERQIRWAAGDIESIPYPGATFDTVISCETIEHVPHPTWAVSELARVLRPGGRLFLTTPNYLGMTGLYRIYLRLTGRRYSEEGQPINHPNLLPLTLLWVRRAGLRIESVDAVGHYALWPGRVPREVPSLNEPRWLMKWFGLHSLVVAAKP